MRLKALAYLLGIVAMFAGLAVLAFSSSRLFDMFKGAAVLSGLGATAWASGGHAHSQGVHRSVAHIALIGGALEVRWLWRS